MSLWDSIKRFFNEGEGEPESTTVTQTDEVKQAFGIYDDTAAGVAVTPESAMRVATVYACVDKLAGSIASLPIKLYETDGVDRREMKKNALWYLLNESPCADFSAASAWENVSISNSLRGDAFWLIRRRPNGQVKDLFPVPYGCVFPERQADGSVRYWIWYPEFNMKTWVPQSDMLHFPGLGFDGLKSMSVIKYAARNATGNALAMDEFSGSFFRNGAMPSVVLSYPKKMSKETVDDLQKAFMLKYSGIENYKKFPLILTEGGSATQLSISSEDAQLLDARRFQVVDIARAFGVPPHMIGETTAATSWGSGIEALTRGFFTYTLQSKLIRIEQELNRKLFPRNAAVRIEFDREAILEGDTQAQAQYYRSALGGPGTGPGWMTVDEIRQRKGLSPLGGNAADIYDPRELIGGEYAQGNGDVAGGSGKPAEEPDAGDGAGTEE